MPTPPSEPSPSPLELHNRYWSVGLAPGRAQVDCLGFDAAGRAQWCPNLLKIGSPAKPRHPIATVCGAQTGYFDSAGGMHLSGGTADAPSGRVSPPSCEWRFAGATGAEIGPIEVGNVRERWRLLLDGPRLEWTIEQEWLADTEVADTFAPGLFFAAHALWGQATVFQLWDKDTAQDGFYGVESSFGGSATMPASRSVRASAGGWGVAKLLSHAGPNGDLRVEVSHHLKKGEDLNFMSVLAQGGWCEPREKRTMRAGESFRFKFVLEADARETGSRLAVDVPGSLKADAAVNRRFFDTHVNCAILADTHDWRFGNEPSGYVAQFCSFMYSQLARSGTPAGALGQDVMDPGRVLAEQLGRSARHLAEHGTVGGGYQNDTSLDILPSFLASVRDLALLTGDRDWIEAHWEGCCRAAGIVGRQIEMGGGMIATARDNGNDYWDWISRNGRIGSINILAAIGLRAHADTARWLCDTAEAERAERAAGALASRYNAEFWDEESGFYADWVDREGEPHFFLYAGPQLQAIAAGIVPVDRARRVVDAILRRRQELGPKWEACFSLQTNFYDAEAHSMMRREHKSDVTRFGQTMNGGCLVSWNFYWIGALVKAGRIAEAIDAWQRVIRRFAATSLVEGCNYWDFSGRPSRTAWHDYEVISYEPFLSDQGLVSLALPRWLLGVEPTFEGIAAAPVLPPDAYPATVTLMHLGRQKRVEILQNDWRVSALS